MKSKLSVALLWLLVFLLGGVSGAVSHYIYREHLKAPALAAPQVRGNVVERMAQELKLDAGQKELLKAIFDESRQKYRALNQEYRPQYEAINKQYGPQARAIRNQTSDKIKQILRADQKELFEEFLKNIPSTPARPGSGAKEK